MRNFGLVSDFLFRSALQNTFSDSENSDNKLLRLPKKLMVPEPPAVVAQRWILREEIAKRRAVRNSKQG